jgi:hypothetical protein
MTPVPVEVAADIARAVIGGPLTVEVLKDKPGRRRTMRASGPAGTVIVKAYASDRATTVAARLGALGRGPREPVVPRVLHVDAPRRLVILSDVPGTPLRVAVLGGDLETCRRAGAALAGWHLAWTGRPAPPLRAHTIDRELAALVERGAPVGDGPLTDPWPCTTVVHRDLYEEQLLTGPVIGLIDLDDAHLGPPELDLGNLFAHLALLDTRYGSTAGARAAEALLGGYTAAGGAPHEGRLNQCEALSRLRLERIHGTAIAGCS